ncbi:MAG: DNA topoisomerase IV subunit A [Rickettsiales bacterium]
MAKQPAKETIQPITLKDALSERYLAYALSTITARSLPDVRDGLKPVHRRLLYAMNQLRLDPSSGFKKCARVVGDVIGKYHPHGDVAVYDTLVRLAQTFAQRYPLVEGQGNFGSIDGDNAAAMRYTEARLTEFAMALLQDLDMDTVDFRSTYDGEDQEPLVLPSAVPNLLANGADGIAVGMATSIPPHNLGELCDALLLLLKKKSTTVEEIMDVLPGPDLPTGGIIAENKRTIREAYETGRGSLRVRAKWKKEVLSHGLYQIVVTEIPYQVSKSRLIEKMADLFKDKKLPLLGNIRDESAEDIRLVLEPKSRSVDPDILMESLFKMTDLQTRVALNLNVLTSGSIPKVLNIKEMLQAFLDHRVDVITRRSNYRLGKINARLEILAGLLICYLNLDAIIKIIRTEDEPKPVMMKKFKLTDNQAEAILNTRLRSLRKLEEMQIRGEKKELEAEKKELEEILGSESKLKSVVGREIKEMQKKFGQETALGKRRTRITSAPKEENISFEAFIENEPITVIYSKMGWIRALKGHYDDISDTKFKEGDEAAFFLKARTVDKILFFATDGKCYTITGDKLPSGKGFGEPLRLMVDLPNDEDIIAIMPYQKDEKVLLASTVGKGFVTTHDQMVASTRGGKNVMNPGEGKAAFCLPVTGDMVACIGTNQKLIIFPMNEIPEMQRGQGVMLQRYRDSRLSDLQIFDRKIGFKFRFGRGERIETDITPWLSVRATQGKMPPTGFPRSLKFLG